MRSTKPPDRAPDPNAHLSQILPTFALFCGAVSIGLASVAARIPCGRKAPDA
jgi:hypothetical protein